MPRTSGELLSAAREDFAQGEQTKALAELRRARRGFRRIRSRNGLDAILELVAANETGSPREAQLRSRLIVEVERDLGQFDEQASRALGKGRQHYLEHSTKIRPPSPRRVRITHIVGLVAIVILVALVITVIYAGYDLLWSQWGRPS
jgi:hypothetical protein